MRGDQLHLNAWHLLHNSNSLI